MEIAPPYMDQIQILLKTQFTIDGEDIEAPPQIRTFRHTGKMWGTGMHIYEEVWEP